jgi:hypothetical protein
MSYHQLGELALVPWHELTQLMRSDQLGEFALVHWSKLTQLMRSDQLGEFVSVNKCELTDWLNFRSPNFLYNTTKIVHMEQGFATAKNIAGREVSDIP